MKAESDSALISEDWFLILERNKTQFTSPFPQQNDVAVILRHYTSTPSFMQTEQISAFLFESSESTCICKVLIAHTRGAWGIFPFAWV